MPKQNSFAGAFWRAVFEGKKRHCNVAFLDLDLVSKLELWGNGRGLPRGFADEQHDVKKIDDKFFC